jgi:carboxypeptidase D
LGFLQNFETLFSISNYKIYVTGESYAGRYVPYVSAAMLNKKDTTHFNLAGTLIYDGCIGQFDVVQEDMVVYPFIKANPQYFPITSSQLNSLKSSHTSCGFDTAINKYLTFPPPGHMPSMKETTQCALFNKAYNYALEANSCFNVYEVNQTCPTPNDPLGDNSPYFNRADVKAAMHAPSSVTWSDCSNDAVFVGRGGPQNEGDLSPNPTDSVLPQVIAATNRTLIANGDLDMIIITNGSLLAIQNMTWGGLQGFQTKPTTPITLSGVSKGIQHFERGLLWTEMYADGHMGPQYQPAVSYRQLQWVLGQIETI